DTAKIHSGQAVRFTVDALSGESFPGVVAPDQPRFNASNTQNVVTFTVVVNIDNSKGRFDPYWTANLEFEVDKRENVLLVPNSALRWKPQLSQIVPDAREAATKPPGKRKAGKSEGQQEEHNEERGVLWKEENGYVRPVPV